MKIEKITQAPFGTILSFDGNIPPDGVVGKLLTADEVKFYKIKGSPTDIWTEVLIDHTDEFEVGQAISFAEVSIGKR